PGLRAGRGLKHTPIIGSVVTNYVAPGLRAGRGLKQFGELLTELRDGRGARPSGRARIETWLGTRAPLRPPRGARPSGRARIETIPRFAEVSHTSGVAPGLRAGRGLKPLPARRHHGRARVAPGLRAGRGLKPLASMRSAAI